jgi:hypothetical protein
VAKATRDMDPSDGASAKDVGKLLGLDKSAARRRLQRAQGADLVANLETKRGAPGRYRTTGQWGEAVVILPPAEDLSPVTPLNHVPPCHRSDFVEQSQGDNGGKDFATASDTPPGGAPGGNPVATPLPPLTR